MLTSLCMNDKRGLPLVPLFLLGVKTEKVLDVMSNEQFIE